MLAVADTSCAGLLGQEGVRATKQVLVVLIFILRSMEFDAPVAIFDEFYVHS
jgi:hypothetical protein